MGSRLVITSQAALMAAGRSRSQLRAHVPRSTVAWVSPTPRASRPAERHTATARLTWKFWETRSACSTPKILRARTQVS